MVEVVEETLKGNSVRLFGQKKDSNSKRKTGGASLSLPKVRRNPLVEIIAINTGCLNQVKQRFIEICLLAVLGLNTLVNKLK